MKLFPQKNLKNIINGPWDKEISYENASPEMAPTAESKVDSSIFIPVALAGPNNKKQSKTKECKKYDDELLHDIESLSKTALRKKYSGEASSHSNMKQRCKTKKYVCHPEFENFTNFLSLMGPKPESTYTLDRIDNKNPEYSHTNCRWASKKLQSWNKSNTVFLTDISGETKTLTEWCELTGTNPSTMHSRRSKGWSDHDVIHGKPKNCSGLTLSLGNKSHKIDAWAQIFPEYCNFDLINTQYLEQRRKDSEGKFELPHEWVIRVCFPRYQCRYQYCIDNWYDPELTNQYDKYIETMGFAINKSLNIFFEKHPTLKGVYARELSVQLDHIFKYK